MYFVCYNIYIGFKRAAKQLLGGICGAVICSSGKGYDILMLDSIIMAHAAAVKEQQGWKLKVLSTRHLGE